MHNGPMGRREILATVVVGGFAVGGTAAWGARSDWGQAWTTPVALTVLLMSIWLMVAATSVLERWRPASRLWMLMAALSVAWSWFVVTIMSPLADGGLFNSRWLMRPILFMVLLAWPSGYLRGADRVWWAGYSVVQMLLLWVVPQLLGEADGRPLAVVDAPALVEIARSFGFGVVLPVGGVVLYVSIRRHANELPPHARRLQQPIVVAAGVVMVSDLVITVAVASDSGFDATGRPDMLGGLFLTVNFLPYVTTPILAVLAVQRARVATRTATSIEIGPPESVLLGSLLALDGDGVEVRFAGPAGSWLDLQGRRVPAPAAESTVVEIRRDDDLLATVTTGARARPVSPDDVERVVAAAGASVDFARLAATAHANRREAINARRAMVDARDAALAQLELDLHDGAQQRLVGLALQASMAKRLVRDDDSVVQDLRSGVDAARREIAAAASGLFPAVVGGRGLEASIANLGACAAMRVEIDVNVPGDIPGEVATAAWCVAAESVANAAKYADATLLRIVGSVKDGDEGGRRLELVVDDNGRGGANVQGTGFAGLRTRVGRLGGALVVASPVGGGTVVRTSLPLPSTNGAEP